MDSTTIVNGIMNNLIKKGKDVLYDKYITRQKVPGFVKDTFKNSNIENAAQSGYISQHIIKFHDPKLKQDQMPIHIQRDQYGYKMTKRQKKVINSQLSSTITNKSPKKKLYKSMTSMAKRNSMLKTKQNELAQNSNLSQFIQLKEDTGKKIVIQRVKIRQQMEDDNLRNIQKTKLIQEYEQQRANQIFQNIKSQRKQQIQKQLQDHLKKGQQHGYFFNDQGAVTLYKRQVSRRNVKNPQQAIYKINMSSNNFDNNQNTQNSDRKNSTFYHSQQNQRIKSARGLAFASSVLKTVNLSRASMNQSYREAGIEEFMQRNDLFNNNHIRQTTSIPYFQPKEGTIYKELSTNQVLTQNKQYSQIETKDKANQTPNKKSFQEGSKNRENISYKFFSKNLSKTEDIQQNNKKEQFLSQRNVKTASVQKRMAYFDRRPMTSSIKTGRIIKANDILMEDLLS